MSRRSVLRFILFALIPPVIFPGCLEGAEVCPGCPRPLTVGELARMNLCQLDALFAAAKCAPAPVGLGRGTILLRLDGKCPKTRARMQGMVWKGKYFYGDGRFTNQWAGFRAVESVVETGPSWYDGQPCVVLPYPPNAKVFGNARDELREIAPNLWLGRFYEVCPCRKHQGYFVLEFCGCASGCE